MTTRRTKVRAFTLVELLVVISIIALLIAVLVPSLTLARKQAKKVVCQANMRSLSMGAFTYATEEGVYPPSLSNFANSTSTAIRALRFRPGMDWLGIGDQLGAYSAGDPKDPFSGNPGNPAGFDAAPRFGALFKLVKDEKAYLCPEDKPGPLRRNTVLGGGGNGKFSFTMFSMLGLRAPESIPPRPQESAGPSRGAAPTARLMSKPALAAVPLFVEEHPEGINGLDNPNGHMEGNFNFNADFVVSRHPGFVKRSGVNPATGQLGDFKQGTTQIGFADGHVDDLAVNHGYQLKDVRPAPNGDGRKGIPYTAEGLLWHFGIEFQETRDGETTLETLD